MTVEKLSFPSQDELPGFEPAGVDDAGPDVFHEPQPDIPNERSSESLSDAQIIKMFDDVSAVVERLVDIAGVSYDIAWSRMDPDGKLREAKRYFDGRERVKATRACVDLAVTLVRLAEARDVLKIADVKERKSAILQMQAIWQRNDGNRRIQRGNTDQTWRHPHIARR